ncbi:MAG: AAA family ATPase [Rhizobiales bacterium]|nr:AAA family ATPase [Hyphomicrobiales bacterium]
MSEQEFLYRMLNSAVRETNPSSARAAAILSWCRVNGKFLGLPDLSEEDKNAKGKKARTAARKARKLRKADGEPWDRLLKALHSPTARKRARKKVAARPMPPVEIAERLGALLALAPEDARLLAVMVALNRVQRASALNYRLRMTGADQMLLIAELAGLDNGDAVVKSPIVSLGLISIEASRSGEKVYYLSDALCRALTYAPDGDDGLIECLVGPRSPAGLNLSDFAETAETADLMCRIISGALARRAEGVNILLYGPPGTGKTELAKVIAQAAAGQLFAVGEVDEVGEEPTRWDRVTSLKLAQRILANRSDAVLLFDEMEDLIGDVRRSANGGYYTSRDGSKVFVNRLLETNPVPTLWTSNAIDNIDPAFLRRMSFVLKMDTPSAAARKRIVARIAEAEGLPMSRTAAGELSGIAPEAVTVARSAIRTACLAGGSAAEASTVANALVCGVRHGHRPVIRSGAGDGVCKFDLGLYHAETDIGGLVASLAKPDAPRDFSLLLMGPAGTGKTALAHHLAGVLDRPLEIKRVSDLVSKWVGETEQNIAEAFATAAERGHVLLFDEIDSLLFDRATASRSWEVSQVNELLTWMDQHPMPFIAATNHAGKLDPAAMRRFVFKLELKPLDRAGAARAYQRFFAKNPPAALAGIDGLTPGDFAVVARQLRFAGHRPEPAEIVELLAAEVATRPGKLARIGFQTG